jgi:hypothetical protein
MEIKMSKDEIVVKDVIEIKDNSEARVAFDLMDKIASFESSKSRSGDTAREYWLKLYQDCRAVVNSGYIRDDLSK